MASRRKFLKESLGFTTLCCTLGVSGLMQACTSIRYVSSSRQGKQLRVTWESLGSDRSVMLNEPSLPAPLLLSKDQSGNYRAFLMLCTHKGCDVSPAGAVLLCPCHGSEFSLQGKVLKGPATENLPEYRVTNDEKYLSIEIE